MEGCLVWINGPKGLAEKLGVKVRADDREVVAGSVESFEEFQARLFDFWADEEASRSLRVGYFDIEFLFVFDPIRPDQVYSAARYDEEDPGRGDWLSRLDAEVAEWSEYGEPGRPSFIAFLDTHFGAEAVKAYLVPQAVRLSS
jgi:hypothetical protein